MWHVSRVILICICKTNFRKASFSNPNLFMTERMIMMRIIILILVKIYWNLRMYEWVHVVSMKVIFNSKGFGLKQMWIMALKERFPCIFSGGNPKWEFVFPICFPGQCQGPKEDREPGSPTFGLGLYVGGLLLVQSPPFCTLVLSDGWFTWPWEVN